MCENNAWRDFKKDIENHPWVTKFVALGGIFVAVGGLFDCVYYIVKFLQWIV